LKNISVCIQKIRLTGMNQNPHHRWTRSIQSNFDGKPIGFGERGGRERGGYRLSPSNGSAPIQHKTPLLERSLLE